MTSLLIKKVPVERESLVFSLLFFVSKQFMTSQRKLCMVGTWSTIQKRAKRILDIIVETTGELGMFLTSMLKPQVLERGKKLPCLHQKYYVKLFVFIPYALSFSNKNSNLLSLFVVLRIFNSSAQH